MAAYSVTNQILPLAATPPHLRVPPILYPSPTNYHATPTYVIHFWGQLVWPEFLYTNTLGHARQTSAPFAASVTCRFGLPKRPCVNDMTRRPMVHNIRRSTSPSRFVFKTVSSSLSLSVSSCLLDCLSFYFPPPSFQTVPNTEILHKKRGECATKFTVRKIFLR